MVLLHTLRNLKVFVAAKSKSPLRPTDEGILDLKVRITDLDFNWHMNNARYVEAFEMGRADLVVR
jgi:acyl-ACP thioesterase